MWTVNQLFCMGILTVLSVIDILTHFISVKILLVLNVCAVIYQGYTRRVDIWLIMGGICVGMILLLISKITHESIGYADSWLILILGIYLGLWELLEVLAGALFVLALASVLVLVMKRMSRKCVLPFIPFLAAGYLLNIMSVL